jgi:hypothetical protein
MTGLGSTCEPGRVDRHDVKIILDLVSIYQEDATSDMCGGFDIGRGVTDRRWIKCKSETSISAPRDFIQYCSTQIVATARGA